MTEPVITVLCGGTSAEREVSLGSGLACAVALARSFPTRMFDVTADALPAGLDPRSQVVFSTLHGTFGEDGGMQALLDAAGVHYAGCDAASSALTMDKTRTKETVAARGLRVPKAVLFAGYAKPAIEAVVAQLGTNLVIKPTAEGSSVGLSVAANRAELAAEVVDHRFGDEGAFLEFRLRGLVGDLGEFLAGAGPGLLVRVPDRGDPGDPDALRNAERAPDHSLVEHPHPAGPQPQLVRGLADGGGVMTGGGVNCGGAPGEENEFSITRAH